MKKSLIIVLMAALLVAPLAAAPTKDEVASTLEGVMVVFAATLMGSMFGMELEGAVGEGDMEMDVTLKGGPVKRLVMKTRGEDLLSLVADGKDFSYLADDPDFILMED